MALDGDGGFQADQAHQIIDQLGRVGDGDGAGLCHDGADGCPILKVDGRISANNQRPDAFDQRQIVSNGQTDGTDG
ncbi:hypothetical protein OHR68_38575 [Spirillospora sp. NBC_00431]